MEQIKRYMNDLKVHTENSRSPYDTFKKRQIICGAFTR